jgi:hypothetical protein
VSYPKERTWIEGVSELGAEENTLITALQFVAFTVCFYCEEG